MFTPLFAFMLAVSGTAPDTVVSLGAVRRDLTGDGVPEVLRLVGVGASIDSLSVTFSIEAPGRVLYADTFPVTRAVREPGSRGPMTESRYRSYLAEFSRAFFEARKFMTPARFLAELRQGAPAHIADIPELIESERRSRRDTTSGEMVWREIQRAGAIIFEYSPGGDRVTAIVWSARDREFYRILECC